MIFSKICQVDYFISSCDTKSAKELFSRLKCKSQDEEMIREGYRLWMERNFLEAYNNFVKYLKLHPSDLFVCKRAQLMALFGGLNDKVFT